MGEGEDRDLEGWKEISAALGVSEVAAKGYGFKGTGTRVPLPTTLNFRARVCVSLKTVLAWKAGIGFTREHKRRKGRSDSEPVTQRTGAPALGGAPS